MSILFPRDYTAIETWALKNGIPVVEARERYAQYGVLLAIANSRELSKILVFKGGNALDFIWHPNRSTRDLDFSTLESSIDEEGLRPLLQAALNVAARDLRLFYLVQSISRNPPGEDKTFATFQIKVGYALPDASPRVIENVKRGIPVSTVVPVEISLNETVCDFQEINIEGTNPLKVSSREDIFAEKLRALLQQPSRNRSRSQDLLDLAVHIKFEKPLNQSHVAEYLKAKSKARDVVVSKSAFLVPEIFERAFENYEALASTSRNEFIQFDEAKAILLGFIETLDIAD